MTGSTRWNLEKDVVAQPAGIVSLNLIEKKHGNVDVFALDAGKKISEHQSPFDALVIIQEGKMRITIGGEPFDMEEKDAILMPATVPHALEALTAARMLLIMIK